jgi:hypothetical protein
MEGWKAMEIQPRLLPKEILTELKQIVMPIKKEHKKSLLPLLFG